MYTRGLLSQSDGKDSVEVNTILWDTGNGGPSVLSESFYNANKDSFSSMVESEDSSIYLADAKTEIKISKCVRGTFTIIGPDKAVATINSTFSVIPMACDVILGFFKDMVFQAPDMLISMIQRASARAKQSMRDSMAYELSHIKGVYRAEQSERGQPRRVRHPHPRPEMPEWRKIALRNMGYRVHSHRPPRNLCHIDVNMAAQHVFSGLEYPLIQTETGQNLKPPWFQRDDLGWEENDSPYPGMFSEFLHFMETSVEKATEEYLAEVRKAMARSLLMVSSSRL